jgi:hypothetical protein
VPTRQTTTTPKPCFEAGEDEENTMEFNAYAATPLLYEGPRIKWATGGSISHGLAFRFSENMFRSRKARGKYDEVSRSLPPTRTTLYQGQRTERTDGKPMACSSKARKPLFRHLKRCQYDFKSSIVHDVRGKHEENESINVLRNHILFVF